MDLSKERLEYILPNGFLLYSRFSGQETRSYFTHFVHWRLVRTEEGEEKVYGTYTANYDGERNIPNKCLNLARRLKRSDPSDPIPTLTRYITEMDIVCGDDPELIEIFKKSSS